MQSSLFVPWPHNVPAGGSWGGHSRVRKVGASWQNSAKTEGHRSVASADDISLICSGILLLGSILWDKNGLILEALSCWLSCLDENYALLRSISSSLIYLWCSWRHLWCRGILFRLPLLECWCTSAALIMQWYTIFSKGHRVCLLHCTIGLWIWGMTDPFLVFCFAFGFQATGCSYSLRWQRL